MKPTVCLFSESEKGLFGKPFICRSLPQLYDTVGVRAEETQGIHYAIQSLLYNREILFCRVKEEGFSIEDYFQGLSSLEQTEEPPHLQAIFLPGVGDGLIIEATAKICKRHGSVLVVTEKDLYDYLLTFPS